MPHTAATTAEVEKRNEVLAGILVATTVLLVGYASGFGHLLGNLVPHLFPAIAQPLGTSTMPVHGPTTDVGSTPTTRQAAPRPAADTRTAGASGRHAPGVPGGSGAGSAAPDGCDPALASAVLDPFWTHLSKGHLEESPGQEVSDALDTDEYVRTHTVLVEMMLSPAYAASSHATDSVSTFWLHVEHGHLQESPGQQVADALDTNQYVLTHTVLLENLLTPFVEDVSGTC